jgi:pimeloyl-ACP methyl ester carboxylesterase
VRPRATRLALALLAAVLASASPAAAQQAPEVSPEPVTTSSPGVPAGGTGCSEVRPEGWQRAPGVTRINSIAATRRKVWCGDGTWCSEFPKSPNLSRFRFFPQKWQCHLRGGNTICSPRPSPFPRAPWESWPLYCGDHELGVSGTADPCGKRVLRASHYPVLAVHGFASSARAWDGDQRAPFSDRLAYLDPGGVASAADGTFETRLVPPFDYGPVSTEWVTEPKIGRALAERIVCIAEESKRVGGPGVVIVVAHSMGGLAARLASSMTVDGRRVAERIGLVVTVGTPNLGSFLAPDAARHLGTCLLAARQGLENGGRSPAGRAWEECVETTGYDKELEWLGINLASTQAAAQITWGFLAAAVARAGVYVCQPEVQTALTLAVVAGAAARANPVTRLLAIGETLELAVRAGRGICAWSPHYGAPAAVAMGLGSNELRALPPWGDEPEIYAVAGRARLSMFATFGAKVLVDGYFKWLRDLPVEEFGSNRDRRAHEDTLDLWKLIADGAVTEPLKAILGTALPSDLGFGDMVVGVGSALHDANFGRYVADCAPTGLGDLATSPCFHNNLFDHPDVRAAIARTIERWVKKELRDRDIGLAEDEVEKPLVPLVGWWRTERVAQPERQPHDPGNEAERMQRLGVVPGVYEFLPSGGGRFLTARLRERRGNCDTTGEEAFIVGFGGAGSVQLVDRFTCKPPDTENAEPGPMSWTREGPDELEACWGGTPLVDERACIRFVRTNPSGERPRD